jgi:hypothetical protein
MNNIYACGLLDDINIEPEQDLMDPSKINVRIKVEETEPRSMEVRQPRMAHATHILLPLERVVCKVDQNRI